MKTTVDSVTPEFGRRYILDGSVHPHPDFDTALAAVEEDAKRFTVVFTELVYRLSADKPWQRHLVQPHSTEQLLTAIEEARDHYRALADFRGNELVRHGYYPNPYFGHEAEAGRYAVSIAPGEQVLLVWCHDCTGPDRNIGQVDLAKLDDDPVLRAPLLEFHAITTQHSMTVHNPREADRA